jgi:transcriptional regulator with XRE-family HTH domain
MVTRVSIDPATAIWARERIGLSRDKAAQLLKCPVAALEKIEIGDALPNAGLFRKMSDVYLLSEATLLGLIPANDRPLPKDFRSFEGAPVALS